MKLDIRQMAALAKLRIEGQEIEKVTKRVQQIIDMMKDLPDLHTSLEEIDKDRPMDLREDNVRPSYSRESLLQNAPQTQAGCIVVPKTRE